MTREEEIIKASQIYTSYQQKPFLDGAKWADKTLIDKACKWMGNLPLEKMDDYFSYSENLDLFLSDFRKAMEE